MLFTLRLTLRSIRGAPLASAIVVLCIGLSVGATTAVFAWTTHLVRRPLPAVAAAERLVSVTTRARGSEQSVSYRDYLDWRDESRTLRGLAAFGVRQFALRDGTDTRQAAEPVWGFIVTDNYFDLLGVKPALGRGFAPGETRVPGEPLLVVISHRLWRQRFDGAAAAIGRRLRLNGVDLTVVGVAPADFGGTYAGLSMDVWVPVTLDPVLVGESRLLESRESRSLQVFGRLGDGVALAQAREELGAIGARLAAAYPEDAGREAWVKPLDIGPAERLASLFSVLLGLTILVTFIVCSNVANLLMLRGAARRYEIGVALALGCGRGRIVGQLLGESAVLAAGGAILGLAVAQAGQQLLPALMPPTPLPLTLGGRLEPPIFLFGLALAAAMVPIFGLLPAVQAFRGAVIPSLRLARGGDGRSSARLRSALVIAQLALSLTTLVCAGLFLRRLEIIDGIDRGFSRPEQVLLAATDLEQGGFRTAAARPLAVERLLSAVRGIPGVDAAAVASFVPLGFTGYSFTSIRVPGYVAAENESLAILTNRVSDGYFQTMAVAIRQGRGIDGRDRADAARVVVVNEAFAERFLRGRDPVGSRIETESGPATVVGVAANGKYRFDALEEASPPLVYVPFAQRSSTPIFLHVRTAGRPAALVPAVRAALTSIGPDLPMTGVTTLDEYSSVPLFGVTLGSSILSSLGLVALFLAATGLYGVMAYRVAQRSRELAVRAALGASRREIFSLVFGDGARQTAIGLVSGLVLSAAIARLLEAVLPRLGVPHPSVFVAAAAVLVAIASAAALLPAVRASRIDPVTILRGE